MELDTISNNFRAAAATLLAGACLLLPAQAQAQLITVPNTGLEDVSGVLLEPVDGTIVGSTGELIGIVDQATGTIVDASGEVIGVVDEATGVVTDATGTVIGSIDETTGQIVDTAGNVIGSYLPVTSGGSPGSGTPGSGAPGAGTVVQEARLSLSLSAPSVQRFSTARRRGLAATSRCSHSCALLAGITVDGRTARRLGLARGGTQVIGTAAVQRDGRMRLRVAPRARRALERYLPSAAKLRRMRSREARLRRSLRQARSASARSHTRRQLVRLRRERSRLARRSLVVTLRAIAFDGTGAVTSPRSRRVRLKR